MECLLRQFSGQSAGLSSRKPRVRLPHEAPDQIAETAQQVERRVEGACVGGSKPSLGTRRGTSLAQLDSERRPTKPEVARSSRARGANHKTGLAQLAGQRPPKPKVRGSTPWPGARHLDVAKWPKAPGCKPDGASPRPFALAGLPDRTLRSNGPKAERSEQSDRRVQASLAQWTEPSASIRWVGRSNRSRGTSSFPR